ncbi:MAG: hypothetical protein GY812_04595 [Actinomycetia bacterium]|nr:hypothetical protein [Actinomycetes bacterium]
MRPARRKVIRRRAIGVCAVTVVALALTLLVWIWLPLAVAFDLVRGKWRLPVARLLTFGACWSWLELAGVGAAAVLWLGGQASNTGANLALQAWWAKRLMGALAATCGLQPTVEGVEQLRPGPVVVLVRHASLADSLLTAWSIISGAGMAPRVVMKKELLVDPCLDIVGNRIPNCFVDRGAADSAPELEAIAAMAEGMGTDDAAVIFPEGTRSNAAKRRKALDRIAQTDPERAERLEALENLLPPRAAGARALIEAVPDADIVIAGHVGFEGLDTFGGILDALGRPDRQVRMEFCRVPRSAVGRGDRFRDWLDGEWLLLDHKVTEARRAADRGPQVTE